MGFLRINELARQQKLIFLLPYLSLLFLLELSKLSNELSNSPEVMAFAIAVKLL